MPVDWKWEYERLTRDRKELEDRIKELLSERQDLREALAVERATTIGIRKWLEDERQVLTKRRPRSRFDDAYLRAMQEGVKALDEMEKDPRGGRKRLAAYWSNWLSENMDDVRVILHEDPALRERLRKAIEVKP